MGWEARSESRLDACCTASVYDNVNIFFRLISLLPHDVRQTETKRSTLLAC